MKKFIYLLLFNPFYFLAQTGGDNTFALLNLPYSARLMSLGGDFLTVKDNDVNLGITAPSLYNAKMNKRLGYNHALLASGITYGMLSFGKSFGEKYTGGASFRYVSYGKQDKRDETGATIGTYSPGEFILGAGLSKQLNPLISVGGNLNLIYSQLSGYNSVGASIDLAGTYELEKANLCITALVKNAGYQFKTYTHAQRSNLPTEFQLGISHKLKHAPFRFSLLMHHLNQWDLTYNDPNLKPSIDPLTGDTVAVSKAGFGKKLANHFTYQLEILISKNIHIRTAFDYHRRQEMKLATRPGLSGFSAGIGMNFKRFSLDYGMMAFSVAGYANMLSLTINLTEFKH